MSQSKPPRPPEPDATVVQNDATVVAPTPGGIDSVTESAAADSTRVVEPTSDDSPATAAEPTVVRPTAPVEAAQATQLAQPSAESAVQPNAAPEQTVAQPVSAAVEDATIPSPVAVTQLTIGSLIRGRYEIVSQLGQGGTGRVFKARDLILVEAGDKKPFVALKVLNFASHQRSLTALHSEAQKAKKLAHPNIVTVFDVDRDDTIVFMTMEYLQGAPLDELLRANPHGLDPEFARSIARDATAGLTYAHKQQIAHADLKPGNVFVTSDKRAKLLDFGIARALDQSSRGGLEGYTPAYASAAVLSGDKPGTRDDLYGLACIIYECFVGDHPYSKQHATVAREKGLKPKPLKAFTKAEWRTLLRVLTDQSKLQTATEFGRQINPSKVRPVAAVATVIAVIAVAWGLLREPPRGPAIPFEELPPETQAAIEDELVLAAEYGSLGEFEDQILTYERVLSTHPGNLRATAGFDDAIDDLIDACKKEASVVVGECRLWTSELLQQSDHVPEKSRKIIGEFVGDGGRSG